MVLLAFTVGFMGGVVFMVFAAALIERRSVTLFRITSRRAGGPETTAATATLADAYDAMRGGSLRAAASWDKCTCGRTLACVVDGSGPRMVCPSCLDVAAVCLCSKISISEEEDWGD